MQKTNDELQKFLNESKKRFRLRKLDFDRQELRKTIEVLSKCAEDNYKKLSKPRVCELKVYRSIWVNEGVSNMIAKMGVSGGDFTASAEFLSSKIPNKEKWLAMVEERNRFSVEKGYKSRLDMYLNNYVISEKEYKDFLGKVDKVISYCNLEVKAWKDCFICAIETSPFNTTGELISFFGKIYPTLKKHEDKVKVELGDKSETKYIKEHDLFKITLNKNLNEKHQMMDLIHELGHVVSMLIDFKKESYKWMGVYSGEKRAVEIGLDFLKKYFPELYKALLGHVLQITYKTLFEIEIYNDPTKDPDRLYSEIFPKNTRSYLLEEDIMYKNFALLPYAVAYVNKI